MNQAWLDAAEHCHPFWVATADIQCFACCYVSGAAVAFGLMGMAEAIQQQQRLKRYSELMSFVATECTCEPASYNTCSFCRTAGRDRSEA